MRKFAAVASAKEGGAVARMGRGEASVSEGSEIRYQPWAAAKKKENFEKRTIGVSARA